MLLKKSELRYILIIFRYEFATGIKKSEVWDKSHNYKNNAIVKYNLSLSLSLYIYIYIHTYIYINSMFAFFYNENSVQYQSELHENKSEIIIAYLAI